jgi:hypothetical protein
MSLGVAWNASAPPPGVMHMQVVGRVREIEAL